MRTCINGEDRHIGNKKAAELLAYLLWHGKPVKKSKLAEILWPDSEPYKARDSLYKACRYLKLFANGAIPLKTQRELVSIDPGSVYCDINHFEACYRGLPDIDCCVQAVSLYSAPFLADEYCEWSREAEAYYDIRYIECVEFLADYYTQNGNRRKADYYRGLLEND